MGQVITTWLLPTVPPVIIAMIGYLQNFPLFYILIGASLAFGGISAGLLRFSEWRYFNQVEDRLIFNNVLIHHFTKKNQNGILSTNGLRIGIQVKNDAMFPISFKAEKVYSEFNGWNPPKTKPNFQEIELPANTIGFQYDENILFLTDLKQETCQGSIDCSIIYGKPGNLKYRLRINQAVFCNFNENEMYTSHIYAQANDDLKTVKND